MEEYLAIFWIQSGENQEFMIKIITEQVSII